MSILEQESAAHVMTESPGHVLGTKSPATQDHWRFQIFQPGGVNAGFTTEDCINNFTQDDTTGLSSDGIGFFNGQWCFMFLALGAVQVGTEPTGGPKYQVTLDDISSFDGTKFTNQFTFLYTFHGGDWVFFDTATVLEMPGCPFLGVPPIGDPQFNTPGTFAFAPVGRNAVTIDWVKPVKSGTYQIISQAQIDDVTGYEYKRVNNGSGSVDYLLFTPNLLRPPNNGILNQLVSTSGKVVDITNLPTGTYNTATLFGGATAFTPRLVLPALFITLTPQPTTPVQPGSTITLNRVFNIGIKLSAGNSGFV